jgi:pyrroloquinoline quinone biosynthesis protein D
LARDLQYSLSNTVTDTRVPVRGNSPSMLAIWRARRSQGMKGKTTSLRRNILIAPGHQLQKNPSGTGHTLVSPKGAVQLNESAATVLALCDGTHTTEDIVTEILRAKGDSLADDVRAFLDAARRRGWIVEG